jgi:hypothetical protein
MWNQALTLPIVCTESEEEEGEDDWQQRQLCVGDGGFERHWL